MKILAPNPSKTLKLGCDQANFQSYMAQDVFQTVGAKRPPVAVLLGATIALIIGLGILGSYVYHMAQTSFMAGGSLYKPKLPEIPAIDVTQIPQCDPSIQSRWIKCFVAPKAQ